MAQINSRVDDEVKPFELSADPFYSKENMAELERRVADIRSGKSTLKEHALIEEGIQCGTHYRDK